MSKRDNLIRLKVDFENIPIFDTSRKIKDDKDLDDMFGDLKKKLFGR